MQTYAMANVTVQNKDDHEMDDLIAQKTSNISVPVKQQITYETYPRKLMALREKVKTFEELFKEYNQGPVGQIRRTNCKGRLS